MIYNFFLPIIIFLNRVLYILGLRAYPVQWGIVYDSVTKQPIDPVIVKLIDANSGKVTGTCITDLRGRYGFLAFPGKFKLLVQRTNYKFPSELVEGDHDGLYKNVYHGELFVLTGDSDVIALNIPMDPVHSDWNQSAKVSVVNNYPYASYLGRSLVKICFWFTLIFCAVEFYKNPNNILKIILEIYAVLLLAELFIPSVRLWGQVSVQGKTGKISGLTVILNPKDIPQMTVAKATTSSDGKFFLRANPGMYLLKILDANDHTTELFSENVKVGSLSIINRNITIKNVPK